MARSLDPAKAAAALARRIAASPAFTAESVAGTNSAQLAFLRSLAPRCMAVCSRRAGKTWALCTLLLLTGLATPNVTCLYVGLTVNQVKRTAWATIKRLIRLYKIPVAKTTEALEIHLLNGSRIYFGSMSDIETVDHYLGDSMAGGVFIGDELQSVPLRVIKPLVEDVIEPCLTDTTPEHPVPGRLVLAGTFRLASGYLWNLYNDATNEYEKHNWNRLANPGLINQQAIFDALVAKKGITPGIARDWLGIPKFDATATAYRYDSTKNSYRPAQLAPWSVDVPPGRMIATDMPANCDTCAVGIDPGARDRFSVTWWYWHSRNPVGLWHGGSWSTERKANAGWLEAGKVLDVLEAALATRGGITYKIYDAGGSKVTLDLFSKTVGHHVVTAAAKQDLFGRVERMAALFAEQKAHVIAGSPLETDYMLAAWDADARAEGKYKWSSSGIHPDIADSAGYGAEPFWDVVAQAPKAEKTLAAQDEEDWQEQMTRKVANANYGVNHDQDTQDRTVRGRYGPE